MREMFLTVLGKMATIRVTLQAGYPAFGVRELGCCTEDIVIGNIISYRQPRDSQCQATLPLIGVEAFHPTHAYACPVRAPNGHA